MNEPLLKIVGELTMRVHTLQREHADALKAAANHHEHGDYTRAAIARHAADTSAAMANLYRQAAGILSGTWLPHPGDVRGGDGQLRFGVGLAQWSPPEGASVAQLQQWRAFVDEVGQETIRQKTWTDEALRRAQATQQTGRIPAEFLPQPDPLTASPEDSGPHAILPASPWADLLERRLALDVGETEPLVGRLLAVDPERLTVAVDEGTHAGETVRVDIAGIRDWQALPEPQAAAGAELKPAGYPEQPAVEAPSLPRRGRKADYAPQPLGPADAEACGRVLDGLRTDEQDAGQPERLIDPDCRDGKCGSCVGGPCQHECHQTQPGAREEAAADGRFQPEAGAGADRAGAVDGRGRPGPDGPAHRSARSDMTHAEQNGAAS